MFDDYKGFIDIDKVLKDEYNYTFNGDLKELYSMPFIEIEGEGVDALCWIKYKNDSYLFKSLKDFEYNVWGELLSEEFAKRLNIPCASYRAAQFGNKKGVLSKQMLKSDETLILGSEIFQDFFNQKTRDGDLEKILKEKFDLYEIPKEIRNYDSFRQSNSVFKRLNNLEQVWDILATRKDISEEELTTLVNSYTKMFLFDIFTLQADRHPNNWGVVKTETGKYKTSPLFDNSTSFGLGYPFMERRVANFKNEFMNARFSRDYQGIDNAIYKASPSFTLSSDNIKTDKKDTSIEIFRDFIRKTGSSSLMYVRPLFSIINSENLEEIIKEVSLRNGLEMNDNLESYIYNVFDYHHNKLATIMDKEYQGGSSKNDTEKSARRI